LVKDTVLRLRGGVLLRGTTLRHHLNVVSVVREMESICVEDAE
jgi:hypothetical protein